MNQVSHISFMCRAIQAGHVISVSYTGWPPVIRTECGGSIVCIIASPGNAFSRSRTTPAEIAVMSDYVEFSPPALTNQPRSSICAHPHGVQQLEILTPLTVATPARQACSRPLRHNYPPSSAVPTLGRAPHIEWHSHWHLLGPHHVC